jgi:nicotinamide-nucleotide amidase
MGAIDLLATLMGRAQTLAVAESLTGGLLAATIVDVPGASRVFRGGVIPYATDLKTTVVGVDADLLAERGPVDPDVTVALAEGVRVLCRTDWGLSTTGVAGPDPQDGVEVGTVYVAVANADRSWVRALSLTGDRPAIRFASVAAVLDLLAEALA